MKLVDITPYFHDKSGGIKRYLLEKINFLENTEIQHVLVVPGKRRKIYYYKKTKVYALTSFPLPFSGGYRFFLSLKEIKEILEIEKPDIVELGGTYLPIPYLKSPKFKVVAFYHSDINTDLSLLPFPKRIRNRLSEFILTNFLLYADLILTPSKKLEILLRRKHFEKVKTVNLGVDINIFNFSKRNNEISKNLGINGKVKILYAGRFSPEKKIDLLLKVIKLANPKDFHFILVGDGPLKRKIINLSKKIPHLTYLDYIHNKEKLAMLYGGCDIYLSTSSSETFGLSFLEAQACGCFLVALNLNLETQPFKEFLVNELKEEAFYFALLKAQEKLSPPLRQRISSYITENFSWKRTFETLVNIYKRLL